MVESDDGIMYLCKNDDCPMGAIVIDRDAEAVCPECLWFLNAL